MNEYNEQLKEKVLSDIKVWWEQSQKYGAKKPFWRIYHTSTKAVKGKKFQENTELDDIDKSFDCLLDNLSQMMPYLDKYIVLSVGTNKTDSAPTQFTFENPLYVNNATANNTISGFSQNSSNTPVITTGYTKSDVDKMVQERLDVYDKLHKEQLSNLRKEMEYKKELEDMKAQIEGIAESNKTSFEKILGIAEHPVISSALNLIIARLIPETTSQPTNNQNSEIQKSVVNKVSGNGLIRNESSNDENNSVSYGADDETEEDEDVFTEKLEQGLDNLETVFPNESIEVIEEIGELARRNPEVVKQLRSSLKQMLNK